MFGILHAAASVLSFILSWTTRDSPYQPSGNSSLASSQSCRCLYEEPCWPDSDAFARLEQELSRPLIRPHPSAQPCHLSPNSSACSAVLAHWHEGPWRAEHPGAMQNANFEAYIAPGVHDACYRNTSLGDGCGQGSVPPIGVEARTERDVQAAVKFAAKHNLRLVVHNTGHDSLGRSSGRGSFMIWTHRMKEIIVQDSFRPKGSPKEEVYEHALTVQAGVQWGEAYSAADKAGRMMVGGVSPGGSVGAAGGFLLGGGHSILSPSYGLGVDNVLEISVVTSDGDLITTNSYQHPDLFWALRGGGGGTFGVVTKATYRTYPIVPVVAALLRTSTQVPQPNAAFQEVFTELVRISPDLTEAGWGAYAKLASSADSFNLSLIALIPNTSWTDANRTILPFFDHVRSIAAESEKREDAKGVLTVDEALTKEPPSFWALHQKMLPTSGWVGFNLEIGSWLLPRHVLRSDYARVAETLVQIPGLSYELVAGGAVSKVPPSSTGLNPAWRNAIVHAVYSVTWRDGSSLETIDQHRNLIKNKTASIRGLAPESGAYFNEASMYEPDARHAFFGAHYDKLRDIKKTWDPIDLFIVTEGVGADEWDENMRCRV